MKNEGPLSLFRGIAPVMIRAFPANAVSIIFVYLIMFMLFACFSFVKDLAFKLKNSFLYMWRFYLWLNYLHPMHHFILKSINPVSHVDDSFSKFKLLSFNERPVDLCS